MRDLIRPFLWDRIPGELHYILGRRTCHVEEVVVGGLEVCRRNVSQGVAGEEI